MFSFQGFKDVLQMVFPSKQKPTDVEQINVSNQLSTSDQSSLQLPRETNHSHGRPELDPDDKLNLFRHLTGITSHPSMAHSSSFFSSGGRPAPNLGIYVRVVRNEQSAKIGFKYFSWLINGCLGLQIIVAAALTALGAAGGSRGAVTVFGAVNTVIAGILTFLKGSGLPNRFKYYQTEWKRVREFIEQRERDFSRPDCDLEVYGVASMVEAMYDEVKSNLEASQPERFAGHSSARKSGHQVEPTPVYHLPKMSLPPMAVPPMAMFNEKSKEIEAGFGNRVQGFASHITHQVDEVREVGRDLQEKKESVQQGASRELQEYADRTERWKHTFGDKVKDLTADIGQKAHEAEEVAHGVVARQQEAVDEAVREARENLARAEEAARIKIASPVTISLSHSGSSYPPQQGTKLTGEY
jgi:hypothetical protein